MASFVAGNIGKQVFGDIQREWCDVVADGVDIMGGGNTVPEPAIDWTNLNYPPCFRLFHYDPKELPTPAARVVRPIHWLFLLCILILCLNIVDNIVLVVGGVSFFRVIFSGLNIIIFVPIFGFVFYEGYKAIGMSDMKAVNWYIVYQVVQLLICLCFIALPYGGINGLSTLKYRNHTDNESVAGGTKSFWLICSIYESSLWGIGALLSLWNLYRTKTFNPYHSQEARTPN